MIRNDIICNVCHGHQFTDELSRMKGGLSLVRSPDDMFVWVEAGELETGKAHICSICLRSLVCIIKAKEQVR